MDSRCDSSYFFFFKGRGKFLIIFLTKMFNRRTNVALAGNVFGLGEGGEFELQNFKFSTNDR